MFVEKVNLMHSFPFIFIAEMPIGFIFTPEDVTEQVKLK